MEQSAQFAECAVRSARAASADLGFPGADPQLIRVGERAVLRLDSGRVIARVERSATRWEAAAREVRVARWLAAEGVRVGAPLAGPQPVVAEGMVVTLWEAVEGGWTVPSELARALRRLHDLTPPAGMDLPIVDPFDRVRERVEGARGLDADARGALRDLGGDLVRRYGEIEWVLPQCVLHGDANIGNILATEYGAVLVDLDGVCRGPAEWDLVLTALYRDLGWHTDAEYAEFCSVYGFDVSKWSGYPVLKAIRELGMTTWLTQQAGTSPAIDEEIHRRIADLADPARPRRWAPY